MIRIFLILIFLFGFIWTPLVLKAEDSCSENTLILTNPRSGHRTVNPSITVRGYLCKNYPLIIIRNSTTQTKTTAVTEANCKKGSCVYYFAALVRNLAPGANQIEAVIPGEDPPIEAKIEVVRTALAQQ